jgi:hypothetical protein
MKKIALFFALGSILSLSSCKYQSNNKIKQADANEGNATVYGVHPDSTAAQLKHKYPADAKADARVAKIRQDMGYGEAKGE